MAAALLFATAAAVLFVLAVSGVRMVRADTLEGWDVEDIALLRDEQKKRPRRGPLDAVAQRLGPHIGRLIGERAVAELRRRIDLAGRPDGMTIESFLQLVAKYVIVMGAAAVLMLVLGSWPGALVALVAAGLLPMSRIVGHQRVRQQRIGTGLPDFLDILAVTVSAGIGFRGALARVIERFDGPLREEMQHTLHQLDVGVPRRQAFQGLRERTDSEAMDAFVSAFLQAEELGAPLADALMAIAVDMRRTAAQEARRKAARTVPRVTLIVTVTTVPPLLIIVLIGLYLGSGVDFGELLGG